MKNCSSPTKGLPLEITFSCITIASETLDDHHRQAAQDQHLFISANHAVFFHHGSCSESNSLYELQSTASSRALPQPLIDAHDAIPRNEPKCRTIFVHVQLQWPLPKMSNTPTNLEFFPRGTVTFPHCNSAWLNIVVRVEAVTTLRSKPEQ